MFLSVALPSILLSKHFSLLLPQEYLGLKVGAGLPHKPRLVLKPQSILNTQRPKMSIPPCHLLGLNLINPTVVYKSPLPDSSTNPADSIRNFTRVVGAGAPEPHPPSDGQDV